MTNFGSVIAPTLVQMSNDKGLNPIFSINLLRLAGTLPLFFLNEGKI
jgi:hypothetical protein